jgi:hypothetical protein
VTRPVIAVITVLLLSQVTTAQQPAPGLPANDAGTALFRGLFHYHKIQPESMRNIGKGYDHSNLIVVVYREPNNQALREFCRTVLAKGGAVLIAADTDMSVIAYFPSTGVVRVTGDKVRFTQPQLIDNGQPTRPLAAPLPLAVASPFSGVERLATHEPSYLISPQLPPDVPLRLVATFPAGANVTQKGREVPGLGVFPLPFALASDETKSRVRCMVLADPDVFSNRMIYTSGREQNPTDNLKFANNTVQWLKGSGRTKCLFVENGTEQMKFDEVEFASIPTGPQLPPPPVPNIDLLDHELQRKMAAFVNDKVDEAERNDAMNRGLLSMFGGRLSAILTVLACLLAFVTYLLFRWRAVRDWHRKTFRPVARDPAMLGPEVAVGSVGHRRLELLRSADYGPVLRQVVLRLFQDRGLPAEYPGDKLPPLDIAVRRPEFLREAIRSLWGILHTTAPVGFGRWRQLEPLLAAVRAAADDDRWRFVAPSPRDDAT